jgi:hypothetical protein
MHRPELYRLPSHIDLCFQMILHMNRNTFTSTVLMNSRTRSEKGNFIACEKFMKTPRNSRNKNTFSWVVKFGEITCK